MLGRSDKPNPAEQLTLNREARVRVDRYWLPLARFAELMIHEFSGDDPKLDVLSERSQQVNGHIRCVGTLLHNMISDIADGKLAASNGLCKYIREQLQGLPELIREANQAECAYYGRVNAHGHFPVRFNFLVGMDKNIENNLLGPLKKVSLARQTKPVNKRGIAERLAKPVRTVAQLFRHAAASVLY